MTADDSEILLASPDGWLALLAQAGACTHRSPTTCGAKMATTWCVSGGQRIDVAYEEGPFKYLANHWVFEDHPQGCGVDFYVDFEFRSRLLQKLIEPLFSEAVRRMVAAFETRARALYGTRPGRS